MFLVVEITNELFRKYQKNRVLSRDRLAYSLSLPYISLTMFSKLKQFKDIRDRAKTLQSALGQERAEGSSGWGKVKVSFDGNQKVLGVMIDPELMNDRAKLEGLMKEAVNDGMEKIQKILAGKMKDLGGLDLAQELQDMVKKS